MERHGADVRLHRGRGIARRSAADAGPEKRDAFLFAFLLVALVVVLAIREHLRHGIDMGPASALGRAQMLFLGVLWVMVLGDLSRYLPFPEGRLVTEGVMHVNAVIVSGMAIMGRDRIGPGRRDR